MILTKIPQPSFLLSINSQMTLQEKIEKIKGKPCIIIFEGWCVGIKAQKEEDENELITWLEENYNLQNAREILKINFVSGYELVKLHPFLEEGIVRHVKAGYNHSDQELERLDSMPYYGKILESSVIGGTTDPKDKENPEKFYGKINNGFRI